MKPPFFFAASVWMVSLAATGTGAEEFRVIDLGEVEFAEDQGGLEEALESRVWNRLDEFMALRGEGEAYFEIPGGGRDLTQADLRVVFRAEEGEAFRGFADLAVSDAEAPVKGFAFRIEPEAAEECGAERFEAARAEHHARLAESSRPGAAWFRHLAGEAREEADGARRGSLDDSFSMFTGGRAVAENLALDRELILASGDPGKAVPVSEIEGVTVEAIDWSDRLPEEEVEVDPLALSIPHDQHALFAPSLAELLRVLERLEREAGPVGQAYSVRNPYRDLVSRYRVQLGLDVPAAAARMLPVDGVAVTGGDPFFATGTDVAVLFETDSPKLLHRALVGAIGAKTGIEGSEVSTEGVDRHDFVTPDRRISSHVVRLGDLVAVTNSPAQIERLEAVRAGEEAALGAGEEFRFFRHRYPVDGEESAFVFLSDATIRRWAGPEVRIGASRRNRAMAALGELTARAIEGKAAGAEYEALLGEVTVEDGRVSSEIYGSLGFLTPTSELDIREASGPEHEAYERWRNGYESGWVERFDPVALRLRLGEDEIEADLTVMPLTAGSEYQEVIEIAGDSRLGPMARRTPPESVIRFAFAVDAESELLQESSVQLSGMLPDLEVNPLAWVGDSVSVDLEDGLVWKAAERGEVTTDLIGHLPILVRVASESRLKLALFLTGVKASVESAAPDAVVWETRKYRGRSYVVVGEEGGGPTGRIRVHYAAMPGALLVSLDEDILRRAMDREAAGLTDGRVEALPEAEHVMLDAELSRLFALGRLTGRGTFHERRMRESWRAIPVLNEWRRRKPDARPVAAHREAFGVSIRCPGGRGYRWNEEARTMESVAFGHPAGIRREPADARPEDKYDGFRSSLAFEDGGLRARFRLGPREVVPMGEDARPEGETLATAADLVFRDPGVTRTYAGNPDGEGPTMTLRIAEVREEDEGTEIVSECVYTPEDGEVFRSVETTRLSGALELIESRDGESRMRYEKPPGELPARLVEGGIHRSTWRGTETRERDGESEETDYLGEERIVAKGTDTVTVPAGTFENCVRVEVFQRSLYGDFLRSERSVLWYHEDVGLVKAHYLDSGDPPFELTGIE